MGQTENVNEIYLSNKNADLIDNNIITLVKRC